MKTIALIAALMLSTAAMAQDKPADVSTPTPAVEATPAPAQPTKFYLELDSADLNSIGLALNELPKRLADPLILKINKQLEIQSKIAANREESIKAKDAPKPKGK